MKKLISFLKKLLHNTHIDTWRSVNDEAPPVRESVLITSGDGTIVDVAQCYKDKNGKIRWQQGGLSSELILEHSNPEYWMYKPNPPKFTKPNNMKYIFKNTDKCGICGDTTSEKCGLYFGGSENIYCIPCNNIKLNEINKLY